MEKKYLKYQERVSLQCYRIQEVQPSLSVQKVSSETQWPLNKIHKLKYTVVVKFGLEIPI